MDSVRDLEADFGDRIWLSNLDLSDAPCRPCEARHEFWSCSYVRPTLSVARLVGLT